MIASKAETMVETIAHLDLEYGGAADYCRLLGLSDQDIAAIVANFKVCSLLRACIPNFNWNAPFEPPLEILRTSRVSLDATVLVVRFFLCQLHLCKGNLFTDYAAAHTSQ